MSPLKVAANNYTSVSMPNPEEIFVCSVRDISNVFSVSAIHFHGPQTIQVEVGGIQNFVICMLN